MDSRILTLIVAIFGVLAAFYIGSLASTEAFLPLALFCGVGVFFLFLSSYRKISWLVGYGITLLGPTFYISFGLKATEISAVLVAILFLAMLPQTSLRNSLKQNYSISLQIMLILSILWCLYVVAKGAYTVEAGGEGLKNFVRSYFVHFAPYAILIYAIVSPVAFDINRRSLGLIAILFGGVTLVAALMRIYQTYFGAYTFQADGYLPSPLFIPGINLVENIYALRGLGPGCVFLGTLIFFWPNKLAASRILAAFLIVLGTVSAVFSGGRAAIAFAGLYFVITLIVLKRFKELAIGGCALICLIGAMNLFAKDIYRFAPTQIARSIQYVMIEKDPSALRSIEGSSDWRSELFGLAIGEWRSSSEIFLFGRDIGGLTSGDQDTLETGDPDKMITLSLERLVTHSTLTDLLLGYGLVGALLNYGIMIFYCVWVFQRIRTAKDENFKCYLYLIAISTPFSIIYGIFNGSIPDIGFAWPAIIAIAWSAREYKENKTSSPAKLATIEHKPASFLPQI